MSGAIEVQKKLQKFPQKIWLEVEDFTKVLELSHELGIAPNVVCSKIISTYLKDKKAPIETRIIKEKEIVEVIVCPVCLNKFQDITSLTEHFKENPSEIAKWLRNFSLA